MRKSMRKSMENKTFSEWHEEWLNSDTELSFYDYVWDEKDKLKDIERATLSRNLFCLMLDGGVNG